MADGILKVGTITTSSGSGTITIPSGVSFSGGGVQNAPAFEAYLNANQSLSNDTVTTIAWNAESLDTDSVFDTATYRFTPNVSGKYVVYYQINIDDSAGLYYASTEVQKNGSNIPSARLVSIWENLSSSDYSIEGIFLTGQGIVDMNGTTDYLTMNAYKAGTAGSANLIASRNVWGAYKLIGV